VTERGTQPAEAAVVSAAPSAVPSALHVNDAAHTAERLVREARRRGYRWDLLPRAAADASPDLWQGTSGRARRALVGGAWLARLAWQARRHDVVHVHSATTLHHTRPVADRFVLHCHGSDVRMAQYDPTRTGEIRAGLRDAQAVFFSTPDLAEHVLPHRADAQLLPVPIDVAELPAWEPSVPAQVVFASRWEAVKGLDAQLATANALVAALAGRAEVVGLDWGPAASEAAALGVRLLPKLDHPAYLRLLAGATAVVGQAAGILSASELEAMGTGAPLAVPAPLPLYAGSPPPVYGSSPESVADAVVALVTDTLAHDAGAARAWVRAEHGVDRGVDLLRDTYLRVLASR
jgi:glycosyltransferase involved in cell wall biosynthesis